MLIAITFAGCDRKVYYNIPKEDVFAFKEGDVLIYKSNLAKIDSFKVKHVERMYDVFDKVDYIENQNVALVKDTITNRYSTNHNNTHLIWFDLFYVVEPNVISKSNYNLGGKTIERVFKITKLYLPESTDFSAIYYTCKYGIIRYDKKDGEYYELQLK